VVGQTYTYDTTAPTVTMEQAPGQADPAKASPINFTATFSEPVTGLASSDVTLTGTAGGTPVISVTGSGTSYAIAVSGMTDGTVVASVVSAAATDTAGNPSAVS